MTAHRTVAAVLLLALIPAAASLPALASLGLPAAVLVALIAFEAARFSEMRERLRHEEELAIARLEEGG